MRIIQYSLGLSIVILIGLMIKVGVQICNGQAVAKQGFTTLAIYGLLAIIAVLSIEKAPKVVGHLLGRNENNSL